MERVPRSAEDILTVPRILQRHHAGNTLPDSLSQRFAVETGYCKTPYACRECRAIGNTGLALVCDHTHTNDVNETF